MIWSWFLQLQATASVCTSANGLFTATACGSVSRPSLLASSVSGSCRGSFLSVLNPSALLSPPACWRAADWRWRTFFFSLLGSHYLKSSAPKQKVRDQQILSSGRAYVSILMQFSSFSSLIIIFLALWIWRNSLCFRFHQFITAFTA